VIADRTAYVTYGVGLHVRGKPASVTSLRTAGMHDPIQRVGFMNAPRLSTRTSRCRRTLRAEGHGDAGWGIVWSITAADCGVRSPFIRAMGCRYLRCAT